MPGPSLTREKLSALEGMRVTDLGGITRRYSPDNHHGFSLVQRTVIVGTGGVL